MKLATLFADLKFELRLRKEERQLNKWFREMDLNHKRDIHEKNKELDRTY